MLEMAKSQEALKTSLVAGILAAAAILALLLFFWDVGKYSFYEPLALNDFIMIENDLLVKVLVATGAGTIAAELVYFSKKKKQEKQANFNS